MHPCAYLLNSTACVDLFSFRIYIVDLMEVHKISTATDDLSYLFQFFVIMEILVCPEPSVVSAHEVGQVKCGSCTALLMYPYGASQVRCSSCQHVIEIGVSEILPNCFWNVISD